MAKKIILLALYTFALQHILLAQEKEESFVTFNNLCIVQSTISPGYMFSQKIWNSYFHGTLEWGFNNNISIRSDGSFFFTSQGNYQPLKANHSLLLGAFYHFQKKNGDFYFGFQPGAAFVQQNTYTYNDSTITNSPLKVTPLVTTTVGANYFFWKYMNLFVSFKYIHGTHISAYGKAIPLDEFRISAGLGWQLQFKKRKKK